MKIYLEHPLAARFAVDTDARLTFHLFFIWHLLAIIVSILPLFALFLSRLLHSSSRGHRLFIE